MPERVDDVRQPSNPLRPHRWWSRRHRSRVRTGFHPRRVTLISPLPTKISELIERPGPIHREDATGATRDRMARSGSRVREMG